MGYLLNQRLMYRDNTPEGYRKDLEDIKVAD